MKACIDRSIDAIADEEETEESEVTEETEEKQDHRIFAGVNLIRFLFSRCGRHRRLRPHHPSSSPLALPSLD